MPFGPLFGGTQTVPRRTRYQGEHDINCLDLYDPDVSPDGRASRS